MRAEVERVIAMLKERPQEVVATSDAGRIVVMSSLTFIDWRNTSGDVIVGASYCGAGALGRVIAINARGLLASEAGVGKDRAGISGLPLLDQQGIPGAAAATMSARLGDGRSLYEDGLVAHANERAAALGIVPDMPVREAARRMLAHRSEVPAGAPASPEVLYAGQTGRVVSVSSLAGAAGDALRADVVCVGSHAGLTGAGYALALRPRGVIANDGGFAKDDSGISALPLFDALGVPAAAVGTVSARLGDARSTYEDGVVSAANATARALGIAVGMAAREAARRMLGE
ncbi:MAG: hypothetical protein HY691_16975 [Chloroflexi bacterium]|nr:hypothetical protein [Chloroflexota bacterium]